MPDPNNPFSYMSPDDMALLQPGDVASLPEGMRSQALIAALLNRTRQPQAPTQPSMTEDPYALLGRYTPEELAQQIGLGSMGERSQLVAQQLAEARAKQTAPMQQHSTLGGAIGSGLGSVIDSVSGGLEARDLRRQQQDILRQQDEARQANIQALLRFNKERAQRVTQGAGMGDVPLPPGMG